MVSPATSTTASPANEPAKDGSIATNAKPELPQHPVPIIRETVESFAVALILAFLFRAFVAEAFVIPTGSMAPTLMGAHKDVAGIESKWTYQCGASNEFDPETGAKNDKEVVGTTCPLSRLEQPLDLRNRPNHATFSGDRILVSKFSYLWSDPKRWDVIVFKYPFGARLNYIKRCVGLPNETLHIQHGDIYVRPTDAKEFSIARKPPNVVEAMLQILSDTNHLSPSANKAGVPLAWQPSPGPGEGNPSWIEADGPSMELFENGWNVKADGSQFSAKLDKEPHSGKSSWLRYYHRVISPYQWTSILSEGKLPVPISPYSTRLVSDFTAYNANIEVSTHNIYEERRKLREDYDTTWLPNDLNNYKGIIYRRSRGNGTDGIHWTGDLATEFDLSLGQGKEASITLDLVEAGIHYQCVIDGNSGAATLTAIDGDKSLPVFESEKDPSAELATSAKAMTSVRSGTRHRLKFANVDNTLNLWVDGRTVQFSPSNRIVSDSLERAKEHRPKSNPKDPLDAAPVGLGIAGTTAELHRVRVWRDIYYIATRGNIDLNDYGSFDMELARSLPENKFNQYIQSQYGNVKLDELGTRQHLNRDALFSTPTLWDKSLLFDSRRTVEFQLDKEQFFPMGDNSGASSDARGWIGYSDATPSHCVTRNLLIGRAVVVFWPHVWMEPIPYLPNFQRMGLIR